MIPYLMGREKKSHNWFHAQRNLMVLKNINWIPRNLGEIDIAFGYYNQQD